VSLGQLSRHVAQTPGTIAAFVTGPTLDISEGFAQKAAGSTSEVLSALEASASRPGSCPAR
jgi:hypothetical protein